MGTALRAFNGMPRMREVPGSGTSGIYNEILVVGVGGIANGAAITLPNAGQYEDKDLKVYLNGVFLEEGVDYTYLGVSPRTQIQNDRVDIDEGDQFHFVVEGNAGSVYDETVVVGVGGLLAGATITLPNSKVYNDVDLKVYLEGSFLAVAEDYNYVGTIPRTQIQTTIDLLEGERLRLRIES